jgi:hypothetical protein
VAPVNVKDLGAAGDGTTDDSAAAQAAVEQAAAAGRPVYFPAGTYLITSPIRTTVRLKVFGDGMWASTILLTGPAGFVDTDTRAAGLEVEDLAFDSDGVQRPAFYINGSFLRDFTFRRVRFTNLAGPIAAPAAVQVIGLGDGVFVDCLWHNPAKYAGFGTGVRVENGASGKRLALYGDNRFLWLNNGVRTEPYWNANNQTLIDSLLVDGAYFDGFWWLLPASNSGQGATVSYTSTTITDTAADFSTVVTSARPNVINVRAMPVRHSGTVDSAGGSDLSDPAADFAAAGVLRGEIVRSGGRWAAVAFDAGTTSPGLLAVEEWLDDVTLLPTAPPAPGTPYTVYGVIIAAATAVDGQSLVVENWRDRHGIDVLPEAGTRYEVLQVRPTYLLFTGPGGVLDMEVSNSTFRRGWADLISVRSHGSRIIGNRFLDGQESGCVISNGFSGHHVVGNTFDRIGNSAIYLAGSQSTIVGNRITGGQTQRPIATANDISLVNGSDNVVAFNVAETGVESQTPHPMILNQCTTGTSTRNLFLYNQKVGELGEVDVVFRGKGCVDNEVVGSRTVDVVAGATGQLVDTTGAGSPEGVLIASPGSVYRRTDGAAGEALYLKESGTGVTGWAPAGSSGGSSGGGQPSGVITAWKTADTTQSTTTLTADPELSLPVEAGATYIVESNLIYQTTADADLRLKWSGPAGAELSWCLDGPSGGVVNQGSATVNRLVYPIGATPNLGGTGHDSAAAPNGLLVVGSTAGSLTLTWAPAHSATESAVRRGSWIRLTRIG